MNKEGIERTSKKQDYDAHVNKTVIVRTENGHTPSISSSFCINSKTMPAPNSCLADHKQTKNIHHSLERKASVLSKDKVTYLNNFHM